MGGSNPPPPPLTSAVTSAQALDTENTGGEFSLGLAGNDRTHSHKGRG